MILSPPLFSELDPEFKSVLGVPTVTPVLFSLTTDFIIVELVLFLLVFDFSIIKLLSYSFV